MVKLSPPLFDIYEKLCNVLDDLCEPHYTIFDNLYPLSYNSNSLEYKKIARLKEIEQSLTLRKTRKSYLEPPFTILIREDFTKFHIEDIILKIKDIISYSKLNNFFIAVEWTINYEGSNPFSEGFLITDNESQVSIIKLGINDFTNCLVMGLPLETRNRNKQLNSMLEPQKPLGLQITQSIRSTYEQICDLLDKHNQPHFTFLPDIFNCSIPNTTPLFHERIQYLINYRENMKPIRPSIRMIENNQFLSYLERSLERNENFREFRKKTHYHPPFKDVIIWTVGKYYHCFQPHVEPLYDIKQEIPVIHMITIHIPQSRKIARKSVPIDQKTFSISRPLTDFTLSKQSKSVFKTDWIVNPNPSLSFTPLPITCALEHIPIFLKKEVELIGSNEIQNNFLTAFVDPILLPNPKRDNLFSEIRKGIASTDVNVVMKFFTENGFPNVRISPLNEQEFAIAGIMDHQLVWLRQGTSTTRVARDGAIYDYASFDNRYLKSKEKNEIFKVFKVKNHPYYIAQLHAQSDDTAFITVSDQTWKNSIEDRLTMWNWATELSLKERNYEPFEKLLFPKVSLEEEIDLQWIQHMSIKNSPWFISESIMLSRFRMNHKGARTQAIVGLVGITSMLRPKKTLLIDAPFIIWLTHKGQITYVAYLTTEHWVDPGNILD